MLGVDQDPYEILYSSKIMIDILVVEVWSEVDRKRRLTVMQQERMVKNSFYAHAF